MRKHHTAALRQIIVALLETIDLLQQEQPLEKLPRIGKALQLAMLNKAEWHLQAIEEE